MRVVAGRFRGRVLAAPEGLATRPTAERAREALFNILGTRVEGACVLDVFAGSGALGLEALSRGAREATFIEQDRAAQAVIRANIHKLGLDGTTLLQGFDATRPPPAAQTHDLVFLDPPYKSGLAIPALVALEAAGWLAENLLAVVEIAAGEGFKAPPGLVIGDERKYGAARLVFLSRTPAQA